MTFRKKLELVLVALFFVFLLFVMSTGSAKADCFPCFEQNTVYDTGGNTGIASYYWQPQAVACGGRFNPRALTAAHRTYPCGSKVLVTNMRNGATVTVTINDRGPFVRGRIIDLSLAAAQQIGMVKSGLTKVSIQRI
jgi:rare lipoprotein A (peptidoglycan hydrolase)